MQLPVASNFKMTADGDAATYAEINDVSREAFEMVDNKCYSNVQTTSTGGIERGGNVRSSTRKSWLVSVIAAAILLMLIFIVFTMSVVALSATSSNVAALQELAGSVDHNSEEFFELRQNYSQLLKIVHRFEFQLAELSQLLDLNHEELSQNYSQLYLKFQQLESNVTDSLVYSEVQQLRSELEGAFINTSCSDLPSSCPSGYYSMRDRSSARVYCDTTLSCGGVTGGWMRVAELNMTDTSQQCPGELVERNEAGIRQCRVPGNLCYSVNYTTADMLYLNVCGRITAYQVGSTNAFRRYYQNTDTTTIDSNYVDGISLTHGNPRQHIWTFAAALDRKVAVWTIIWTVNAHFSLTELSHHLWERITSVMLAMNILWIVRLASKLTLCGIELKRSVFAVVVLVLILHGSTSSCHRPPLTISRLGCARMRMVKT